VLAAIDRGTTVPRILAESGGGVSIPPDDPEQFTATVASLVADRQRLAAMGRAGRRWVESAASPAAVAVAYEALLGELGARR
jgi:colanic acid biosynthesis glycosyl transferase WcaI